MAAAPNFLLIGLLLPGALCHEFQITIPESIKALRGSCVTIPCCFDVDDDHAPYLQNTCKAMWKTKGKNKVVFDSFEKIATNGELRGNLIEKDCTTILNNLPHDDGNEYYFRLECPEKLKYSYLKDGQLIILVQDALRPTLTASTLQAKEGTSVSLTCSAPAPCLSHPPTLTWTPSLGISHETLLENQDKTKDVISVLNFTASHLHHRQEISCTAVYNKLDNSTKSATSEALTLNIKFAPRILTSSFCNKTSDQLMCSCETVGNPPPSVQWYLNGLPVKQSNEFSYSSEPLNDTSLSGIITVSQPQGRDLSILLCNSSNSLGFATQRFPADGTESQNECAVYKQVTMPIFIIIICVLTVALVCAILFAIRAKCTCYHKFKSQFPGDTTAAVMSRDLTSEMRNKVSVTSEEDIYVNTNTMRTSEKTETQQGQQQVVGKSTEETKNEEGSGVIYSSVIWKKRKKKKEKRDHPRDRNPSGSSYLEEERCMQRGTCRNFVSTALEMESLYGNIETRKDAKMAFSDEYAQVTFRDKNMMHK